LHPPRARTAVVLLLAALGLFGFVARPAAAADDDVPWTVETAANKFGADRQDYRYTVNPGGRVEDGIVVVNQGTTPLHLALRAADGVTTPEGKLDLVTKDATSTGVSAWVHPARDDVTVRPGESVEVPFTITLPNDAAPGDYVGGIVTSPVQADEAGGRAAIQVRLRAGGALKPSLSVERVHVHYSHTPNPIAKGDATVTYSIHNTGNAILTARQSVSVSGPFGRWAVRAGKIVDAPPLLPGETWKVSAPLHGVTPALRLTATVTLVPLLTDAAGSIAPLAATKATGHAWTIPWSLLVPIVVLCGLVVAGLAFRRRRRDRDPIGPSRQDSVEQAPRVRETSDQSLLH
jgi:hypothetical protein